MVWELMVTVVDDGFLFTRSQRLQPLQRLQPSKSYSAARCGVMCGEIQCRGAPPQPHVWLNIGLVVEMG